MISVLLSAALAGLPVDHTVGIGELCRPGYSATVRPSTSYTNARKRVLMVSAGLSWSDRAAYALDHRVPIALGGAPRDYDNLFLIPTHENTMKSVVERDLLCRVCAGTMTLKDAQRAAWNWQQYETPRNKCHRRITK